VQGCRSPFVCEYTTPCMSPLGKCSLLWWSVRQSASGCLWDSTWWNRTGSGALFGAACVWLADPYIEAGTSDVLRVMKKETWREANS